MKEGKQVVLSDADLDVLLYRRPEVFQSSERDVFPMRVEWYKMAWTEMYLILTMWPLAKVRRQLFLSMKRLLTRSRGALL